MEAAVRSGDGYPIRERQGAGILHRRECRGFSIILCALGVLCGKTSAACLRARLGLNPASPPKRNAPEQEKELTAQLVAC